MGKILIVTSVEAEKRAVEAGIRGDSRFCVAVCGVGPYQAAVETARLLAQDKYRLVVNAGIAGGFKGRAAIGAIVFGEHSIVPELGAETPDGQLLALDTLGFGGETVFPGAFDSFVNAWLASVSEAVVAPILTVSTVTGSTSSTKRLAERFPFAAAEAMEGFAVATAAKAFGIPFIEVRAISNAIGPRDREGWRIPQALQALEQAFRSIVEVQE